MIIPTFEPIVGGAERQLQGIAAELAGLGHEVTVVTRRIAGTPEKAVHPSGYSVRRLPTLGFRFGFHLGLAMYLLALARRFDIVHCHTLSGPAHITSVICSALRRPVLLKITRSGKGSQISRLRSPFWHRFTRLFWSSSWVRFVAITRDTLAELSSFGVREEKCVLIPNGVRVPEVGTRNPGTLVQVVYTGRLIKRKRVDLLLTAFRAAASHSRSRLTIIGDGPLRQELERHAEAIGVSPHVEFTGEMAHDALNTQLRASDVFVLPSDSEGMSNSLLEAMACGLLVIAADIEANRELIDAGENGLLFTDESHLQRHLDSAIQDHSMRSALGTAARQTIATGYSFQAVALRYVECYETMLPPRQPGHV